MLQLLGHFGSCTLWQMLFVQFTTPVKRGWKISTGRTESSRARWGFGKWKKKRCTDDERLMCFCSNEFLSNKNPWMMENHKSLEHALLACQHARYSHTIGEFDSVKLLGLYSLFTILGGCWCFFWWLISCTTWSILLWVCLNILNYISMSKNNGI